MKLTLNHSLRNLYSEHDKGKEKIADDGNLSMRNPEDGDSSLILFLKLLNKPLFPRNNAHLEQVMTLVQVIIFTVASKLQNESPAEQPMDSNQVLRVSTALETAERAVTLT
ncbi:E3 ubiquitin-protein ligase upl1 [Dionaea muscipula]